MRCGDFSPDTCCLTLQLKVPAITLRRKSARRSIVDLILVWADFVQPKHNKKGQAMKSLLDHKRTMNNNEESDTALYGTTNRHTNWWPLNFVGSGIRFTWGVATRGRRFDDRVRSFTRTYNKVSSLYISYYKSEVFMKCNVAARLATSLHLTNLRTQITFRAMVT